MREKAKDKLNQYLASALGEELRLRDVQELSRQRTNFLAKFGPEKLNDMSDEELLTQIPLNAVNDEPMDYWLEFKNDHDFEYSLFGGIGGGSATKYGTWQEKITATWRARQDGGLSTTDISSEHALEIVSGRRLEMLDAVDAVESFRDLEIQDIDPNVFQHAVMEAAPRWGASAWLHKYLHMNYPELVTWHATSDFLEAALYHVGVTPREDALYAHDIDLIRFWSELPALQELPLQLRYRAGQHQSPRQHWCLGLSGEISAWKEMVANGHLALGPKPVGNLAVAQALAKKKKIQRAIEQAFEDAGLDKKSAGVTNLTELTYRLEESSLVALFTDARTVVAVGRVHGTYRYVPHVDRPHQVAVEWLHTKDFEVSRPLHNLGSTFQMLKATDPVVADIEASLLANGVGFLPGFSELFTSLPPHRFTNAEPRAPREPLPPPTTMTRQVLSMLERKRQVILYGPPGTGKTFHAEQSAREIIARHNFNVLPSELTDKQRDALYGRSGVDPYIRTCTFHPMYSYEDFIEGYRPNDKGHFDLEDGIFKSMAVAAQAQPQKKFVLIIDEINRGNIPKIFGELITLVEASKRGTTNSILPLSKKPFTVPDNLYIIGTMNTADRSILLLDTALRRRFAFKELMPKPSLLRSSSIADVSLSTWLRALNRRIVENLGRDGRNLQIGHAYLMSGTQAVTSLARIGEIVRDDIWPLIQEYCYEDPKKIANILASDKGGLFDRTTSNLRFELFDEGREDELITALTAIVTPEDKKQEAAHEAAYDEETAD